MKLKSKYLPFIFVLITIGFLIFQRINKPRILILQSYHKNMTWVRDVDRGIDRVLNKVGYITIRRVYLNTKKYHTIPDLYDSYRKSNHLINSWRPNVVIAVDDYAQILAAQYFVNQPNIHIVFAGIDHSYEDYGYADAKNVTGIIEDYSLNAIKEIIPMLFTKAKRIYYISDESKTALIKKEQIINYNWAPYKLTTVALVSNYNQWQKAILAAQKNADIILVGTYFGIKDKNNIVNINKLMTWTLTHSKIPLIGLTESFYDEGGYLAIAPSATEQGEVAASLALKIITNNKSAAHFPIIQNKLFQILIRQSQLKKVLPSNQIPLVIKAFAETTHSIKP